MSGSAESTQTGNEQDSQTSPETSPETTTTPSSELEDQTSTPDSTTGPSSKDFDDLRGQVAQTQAILNKLPELITAAVGGNKPTNPVEQPPEPPEDDTPMSADDFYTNPVESTEKLHSKLFNQRIAPLIPHLRTQETRLFDLEHELAKRDDPEAYELLKDDIDKYLKEHPEAKSRPHVVKELLTYFKGQRHEDLKKQALEKLKQEIIVAPAGSGGSGSGPSTEEPGLSDFEEKLIEGLGLSREEWEQTMKEAKEAGRLG
jgi:hypothetical protein